MTKSLSEKVVKGGLWVFALRIINRESGFIRTIVIAKFLAPEDFKLFEIASQNKKGAHAEKGMKTF